MRTRISLLVVMAFCVLMSSCGRKIDHSKLLDSPQLITVLQAQVDSVVAQGYRQIDQIDIYTKSFAEHGPDDEGYLHFMAISAVPADTKIGHLANFSYLPQFNSLTFNGYPVSPTNKRKEYTYSGVPDLTSVVAKLDEMKALIPMGYAYSHILYIGYAVIDNRGVYKLDVEVKPEQKEVSHPDVSSKEVTHTTYSRTKSRKKFGRTKEEYKTDFNRKMQHKMSFVMIDGKIEIR